MINRTSPRLAAYSTIFEHETELLVPHDCITVVVSLFNYARFVIDCLESIKKQSHINIDLIVVDDHSTKDNSVEVVCEWMRNNTDRFNRVSLLKHHRNQGSAEARNTAFEYARTDPVFVMDADNEIYPRTLARLFEFIKFKQYDAAYTQSEIFGDKSEIGYADIWKKQYFKPGNYVDLAALISKRSWRRVGGYSHIEEGWEDFDFWCKFINMEMKAIFIPEILCRYRVHESSKTETETRAALHKLCLELTFRHPWLMLG